jgi:hypothetical protein
MKLNLLPAKTGLRWIKQGIRLFFRQPLAMSGLFFMFMAGCVRRRELLQGRRPVH